MGNVSETPTPTTCLKSTAVHLQFVRQYAPHLYHRTFLELSFEERETLQYASHLYCSTPPICTAVRPPFVRQYFWKNTGGWVHRNVSDLMLGRDCFRALFRKQFPPPLNWLKSGFSRKSQNGFKVGEKWVSTHFWPIFVPKNPLLDPFQPIDKNPP